jgi:hypothetical protein
MQFLCLGYHDEQRLAALSAGERDELVRDCLAFENELRKSGRVLASKSLQGAAAARTVRFHEGQASTTDGPFAETKEQIGGFMVLEADDLNHAIRLVADVPCRCLGGGLEIRPINRDFPAIGDCPST